MSTVFLSFEITVGLIAVAASLIDPKSRNCPLANFLATVASLLGRVPEDDTALTNV